MQHGDDQQALNLRALRFQVRDGNFAVRAHAMQHAVKEGFSVPNMVQVILDGILL